MIPNNQIWFNSGGIEEIPNPNSGSVYNYTLVKNNTQNEYSWRDGLALVEFEGKLRMMGGWSDNPGSGWFPDSTTNQQWESNDKGYTWTQISNANWNRRHSMGYGIKDNKIWIWGGDLFFNGIAQKDVWSYTTAGGWVQETSNWGVIAGERILFSHCIHNGYLYMAGGQTGYGNNETMFTDIVRSSDGITWTKIGNLPSGLNHFSAGIMYSLNGKLYITSGGEYKNSGHTNFNNKVYMSLDEGSSWIEKSTLPVALQNQMYANGTAMDGKLWMVKGFQGGINTSGLYYSLDGISWTQSTETPADRHACGICTNSTNDELYIVSGNETTFLEGPFVVNAIPQNLALDSDAQAFINKLFPTASNSDQIIYNDYIVALKASANGWDNIESIRLLATTHIWHSWIDMKRPNAPRVLVSGAPTFTANLGYTFSPTNYLNSNFNFFTDSILLLKDNLFHGIYSQTNSAAIQSDAGAVEGFKNLSHYTKWSDGFSYIGTCGIGEETLAFAIDTRGLIGARRIGTANTGFRNGVVTATTVSAVASDLPNLNDFIGCVNSNGIASNASTRTLSMRILAKGDIDIVILTSATQTLATSKGFIQL